MLTACLKTCFATHLLGIFVNFVGELNACLVRQLFIFYLCGQQNAVCCMYRMVCKIKETIIRKTDQRSSLIYSFHMSHILQLQIIISSTNIENIQATYIAMNYIIYIQIFVKCTELYIYGTKNIQKYY